MLAVIIPTYNAQDCLPQLFSELEDVRVVISDGGSTDGTLITALSYDAVIARGIRGRGVQMARGAELAGAVEDITAYLFLHADCKLPPNWLEVVKQALKAKKTAWHFRYAPDGVGLGVTWLKFIVWLRGWAWRLPYGDQGLLIPREMYEAIGGYDRNKPLFEDVDILDRIKSEFGRSALKKLPIALTTDISDHLREGIWTRGWRNYRLLKAYRRGESMTDLVREYG